MLKKVLALTIGILMLVGLSYSQEMKFNPSTGKADWIVFSRVTAVGDILYHDGTLWQVLNRGANGEILTLAAGIPSWAGGGGALPLSTAQYSVLVANAAGGWVENTLFKINGANVTTGGWQGTAIGQTYGGTGIDSSAVTDGQLLIGNTAGNVLALAGITGTANQVTVTNAASSITLSIPDPFTLPGVFTTPWTNVFYVDAGGGGDYTTIQAALTAQSAGGELFLVAPGDYTDDTINFSAANQCVVGMGLTAQVHVTTADATICNFGAWTGCRIENIKMTVTAATTAKDTVTGTGEIGLRFVHIGMANASVTTSDQPSCIDTTGTVKMKFGKLDYDNPVTDGAGNVAIKSAIRLGVGASVTLTRVDIDIDGAGQSLGIVPGYGLAGTFDMSRCTIDVLDNATSNAVGMAYSNIVGGSHEVVGCVIHVANSGGTAKGAWLISSETVRSMYNHIHITGATANSFDVGAGATVISQLDDIIAANGSTGAGTLTMVSSETDGNLTVSGLTASHPVFTDANNVLVSTGTMPEDQGGTGLTSYTIGDLIYADGAASLAKLSDVALGQVLISGGVGVAPSWSGSPSVLTLDVNYGGATGESGVDFNSISNTFASMVQSDAEGIAVSSDTRIGLDETLRTLIICDRGDIVTDFGLTASGNPTLWFFDADYSDRASLGFSGNNFVVSNIQQAGSLITLTARNFFFTSAIDNASGNANTFNSSANIELTRSNAQQSWMYIEPKVLQTGTAAFDGLYLNVNGTVTDTYGDGSTGDGNNLIRLARVGTTYFKTDLYGYTKSGTSSSSLADNDTFDTTIADSWTGIVIVQNTTDTTSGVYHLDGATITAINQNAGFTVTQGTNDKINVYINANVIRIENTWAAAKTVKVTFIGT